MTTNPLLLRTRRCALPEVTKLEITLRPHRLRINYAADDCESISLTVGEYRLIHRVLAESGHTELSGGVWA